MFKYNTMRCSMRSSSTYDIGAFCWFVIAILKRESQGAVHRVVLKCVVIYSVKILCLVGQGMFTVDIYLFLNNLNFILRDGAFLRL
jgi:hypothetical protein